VSIEVSYRARSSGHNDNASPYTPFRFSFAMDLIAIAIFIFILKPPKEPD